MKQRKSQLALASSEEGFAGSKLVVRAHSWRRGHQVPRRVGGPDLKPYRPQWNDRQNICQGPLLAEGAPGTAKGRGPDLYQSEIGLTVPHLSVFNITKKFPFVKRNFLIQKNIRRITLFNLDHAPNALSIRYFIVSTWIGFVR